MEIEGRMTFDHDGIMLRKDTSENYLVNLLRDFMGYNVKITVERTSNDRIGAMTKDPSPSGHQVQRRGYKWKAKG